MFAFLAAHRRELFPDELFADLFPSRRGRPSIPADVVASVIVLQTLHGLSDSEAVEAVTFDLRWKAACGLAVTAAGFHPTVLTYWRRRLAASARPRRIFDVVGQVVAETGVAEQGPGHELTRAGKPGVAWDEPGAPGRAGGGPGWGAPPVAGHLPEQELGPTAAEAVGLLALVAGQDVEPAEGSDGTDGRWRIARRTAPDRLISTVDPDTRHAHKTRQRHQDGYKAHLVVEPDTGI